MKTRFVRIDLDRCSLCRPLVAVGVFAVVVLPSTVSAEPPPSSTIADQRQSSSTPSSELQGAAEENEPLLGSNVYRELSRASGGLSYNGGFEYMGEALKIFFDMDGPGASALAVARGSLASSRVVKIPVVVDSTVKQVDFILSTSKCDSGGFDVMRPDGSIATVDEDNVEVIDIPALTGC